MSREGKEPLWKTCLDIIPEETKVLIQALRASLTELTKNLGAIHSHYQNMRKLERGKKKAKDVLISTSRRLLNMILVGQVGYKNGHQHVDRLFKNLKELLTYSDELVPLDKRKEIAEDYAVIFTGYNHGAYEKLIKECKLEMGDKAFAVELNFDLTLLGKSDLNKYPPINYDNERSLVKYKGRNPGETRPSLAERRLANLQFRQPGESARKAQNRKRLLKLKAKFAATKERRRKRLAAEKSAREG